MSNFKYLFKLGLDRNLTVFDSDSCKGIFSKKLFLSLQTTQYRDYYNKNLLREFSSLPIHEIFVEHVDAILDIMYWKDIHVPMKTNSFGIIKQLGDIKISVCNFNVDESIKKQIIMRTDKEQYVIAVSYPQIGEVWTSDHVLLGAY